MAVKHYLGRLLTVISLWDFVDVAQLIHCVFRSLNTSEQILQLPFGILGIVENRYFYVLVPVLVGVSYCSLHRL